MTRWCKDNYVYLKVNKTQMVVDNRKKGGVSELIIEGMVVETVNEQTHLGTFECNTNNIVKKCHQRMFCMFRLRYLDVSPTTLYNIMFYCSLIESVLTSCLVCWFGTLPVKNRGNLNSIVNIGTTVVGVRQTGQHLLYASRAKK